MRALSFCLFASDFASLSVTPIEPIVFFFFLTQRAHRTPPRRLVLAGLLCPVFSILSGARLIEIGAVKRPHRQAIPA